MPRRVAFGDDRLRKFRDLLARLPVSIGIDGGINCVEMHNRYECPSMHRMILWAAQVRFAYRSDLKFTFTSGAYAASRRSRNSGVCPPCIHRHTRR